MWIAGSYQLNQLEDETDFFQYGQYDEISFYTFQTLAPQESSWINFPTDENPSSLFKYSSFEIELNQDVMRWSRQTYSLLDFLGDIGGLFDCLIFIGWAIVDPFKQYAL